MYAVIADRGKQYFMKPGETVRLDRLAVDAGAEVVFDRVLLLSGGDGLRTGTPVVDGVSVRATVIGEIKDRKLVVFKKKRRKGYRRKQGHRQRYTNVRVEEIRA
jgi:large subunit ribosomal protein L21